MEQPSGDTFPRPDPTKLTTEQLHRELETLDKKLDREITHSRELREEKFASVSQRFIEVKQAVDTAFEAQKESISKSEKATSELLSKQGDVLTTKTEALDGKINDIKDRLTKLESMGLERLKEYSDVGYGERGAKAASQTQLWLIFALIATLFVSLLGTAVAVLKP